MAVTPEGDRHEERVGGVGHSGSAFVGLSARRGRAEPTGLVLDGRGDLLELVSVLAGMVGAEQQLTAARELDPNVGLSTASVTAVQGCELRTGCDCSGHVRAFLGVASGDDDEFGIVYNNITSRLDIPGAASVRGLGRADMSTVCRNPGPPRRHRMYWMPNRFRWRSTGEPRWAERRGRHGPVGRER